MEDRPDMEQTSCPTTEQFSSVCARLKLESSRPVCDQCGRCTLGPRPCIRTRLYLDNSHRRGDIYCPVLLCRARNDSMSSLAAPYASG